MKLGFGRPRPDLVPHEAMVYTANFPSGHSMMSGVTYLTLAALLILAILLALLVGASRVYLGVHWPTNILAGWTAGANWAAICWGVMHWMQGRGQIEKEAREASNE
ncbi:phosphatase PAP2 family protein [Halomonas sp. GD1P12]|uniref:phosphatase PAP2 family protein n=1 Tax=Halomonas sp. GD1P12 TaxID=2982691 RepID=UPI0021E4EFE2|nr:phosphatase PAP2 family protein [Halomonas sp. GD1P12]UYG01694.1 phosphatase PAP2 family protein [Halomonas sp. GD1P12]